MPSRRTASWKPIEAVVVALLISFGVYFCFDLTEYFMAPHSVTPFVRLSHFVRGFLVCASGLVLVWLMMSKTELELTQQRMAKKALLDEREDFLAVINHRLRNPLIATERVIDLFLSGDFGKLDERQRTILEHVAENNKEVDRLVRTLIDIYKYRNQSKALNFEEVSVADITRRALDHVQVVSTERLIAVDNSLNQEWRVKCDQAELGICLVHLIENAIKHARTVISISGFNDGRMLRIVITDDGTGIAAAELPCLFNRFIIKSLDGKYSQYTGIGLCLCAEIVTAHRGTLSCRSEVGSGTTFELTLPVDQLN